MNTELLVPLCAGATAGGGAFVSWRAVRPSELTRAVGRVGRASTNRRADVVAATARLGHGRRERDLAIAGRDASAHAIAQLSSALTLAATGIVLALGGGLVGVHLPSPTVAVLGVAGVVAGFVWQDASLRRAARRRRRDLGHALSSYLDLVNVLLAGGAGIETALTAAADAGDGWAFAELRATMLRARAARRSVWSAFGELGELYGVDDLVELSASIQLAGEQGARVASSLAARAAAMRDRLLARVEADAQSASERMGLPTVLMFVAFLFLLGYPAVQIILGST